MVLSDSSSNSGDEAPAPAPSSILQTINIRSHIPILLDIDDSNYDQWRCFFDSILGKFGIDDHVRGPTPAEDRDAEWRMIDHCIVNWLHNTIAKNVFDIIFKPRASAFTVWSDIEGIFRDNELQRAVYLEHEFRSIVQGDMTMLQYTTRLKKLADDLRAVGQPVSEPSQVLNLLRGLNTKYRYVKPVITSKSPPHTFRSATSFLLLEETQLHHDTKMEAGQALYAGHGGQSNSSDGASNSRSKGKSKKRTKGGGSGGSSGGAPSAPNGGGGGGGAPQRIPGSWSVGPNPWTGLVQAWQVPFRAPGAGVLGPRPPFQAQQAMTAQHLPQLPAPPESGSSGAWDNSALFTALQSAGVATTPPSAAEWYFDTGASTHMSSSTGSSNANGEAPM